EAQSYRQRLGPGMTRLIDTEFSAAGKRNLGEQTPAEVLDRSGDNVVLVHFSDERLNVVANEVELIDVVLLRGMHGHFCWRQSEDQPTASNINIGKTQHVPQKCAVRLGIGAVNDRVGARNHVRLDPATAKTARRKFLDCVIAANLFELGGPIVLQL